MNRTPLRAAGRPSAGDNGAIVLSATVMAHPHRSAMAERLVRDHPELGLNIVYDPEPAAANPSALRAARLAWSHASPDATHHLVLQDDSLLCPDFADSLLDAIAQQPNAALCLFTEWGSRSAALVRLAALTGSAFAAVVDPYLPSQGLVLPREYADGFADASADGEDTDDGVLGKYVRTVGLPAYVMVPNLVEHGDSPSIVGNDVLGERKSACFTGNPHRSEPAHPIVVTEVTETVFMSWMRGVAEWQQTEDPYAAGDTSIHPLEYLESQGFDASNLAQGFQTVLNSAISRRKAPAAINQSLLFELFCGYFAFGLSQGRQGTILTAGVDDEVVRAAFSTAAPGGFRRFISASYLREHLDGLSSLAQTAFRAGYAAANAAKEDIAK